ncbi:MAG: Rne/Rng family ribonuclease [Elusimicrobiota bacterium]|nr:Rne/Rng family ribonuclease [Elusimicrobiota bacterium]
MKKEIIVNRALEETRVAVLEDGKLFDLFIERRETEKILNNIYKGVVQNIVPALSSAFIDLGFGKSAYLGVGDVISKNKTEGNNNVSSLLKTRQEIMVQVYKEPISTKGPKVTMDISLPGRLLVYMPYSDNIGISRNVDDKKESDRLKSIAVKLKKDISGGLIIRTEAEDATEEEIAREIRYLSRLWRSILDRFKTAKPQTLIHKDLGVVFQTVRDYFSDNVELMHIDSQKELKDVMDFMKIISPEFTDRIALYDGDRPIFDVYGIEDELKHLLANKIKLKSGGYLIIQEAESLCAIDVNSGKFTSKNSQEDTAALTNIEAAEEVARQLRLRNIGGIIVIDFIDMKKASNRQKVLEKLRSFTRGDKAKIKIWPITKLGLVEMTRERKRESLLALMGETCPLCNGVGQVVSRESIFTKVCCEIDKMNINIHRGIARIKLNPAMYEYFLERKGRLKELFNIDFEIKTDLDLEREDYKIILE